MSADVWSQRILVYADRKPMGRQLKAVYEALLSGGWWTFESLRHRLMFLDDIGISEAGVSARIRDLRKPVLWRSRHRTAQDRS